MIFRSVAHGLEGHNDLRKCVEVMRRYSNRPDLLGPMLDVLRRVEDGDKEDEPGGVESRECGPLRPSDRLSEADVREVVNRFRAGVPKRRLAVEYGMSLSTVKRLLRKRGGLGGGRS